MVILGYGIECSDLSDLRVLEVRVMLLLAACRFRSRCRNYADLCSDLVPKITCQVVSPGLSIAAGFEHPASTLPTRFPAALGIGHG